MRVLIISDNERGPPLSASLSAEEYPPVPAGKGFKRHREPPVDAAEVEGHSKRRRTRLNHSRQDPTDAVSNLSRGAAPRRDMKPPIPKGVGISEAMKRQSG